MTFFASKETTTYFFTLPEKIIYRESQTYHLELLKAITRVLADQMWKGKENSEGN